MTPGPLDWPATTAQRAETVRWEILNVGHEKVGTLASLTAPSVSWSVGSQQPQRTLDGVTIQGADADLLDPDLHRLRVVHVLGNGDTWYGGVYLIDSAPRRPGTRTDRKALRGVGEEALLDQPTAIPYSLPGSSNLVDAAVARIAAAGYPADLVDATPSPGVNKDPMAWPTGSTFRQQVADITLALGYLPPHTNHAGRLQLRPPTPVTEAGAALNYDLDEVSRVLAGSITVSPERLRSYNTWLVISSSPGATTVVGAYTLPDAHPLSAVNVGTRTRKIEIAGLTTTAEAEAAAHAAALRDKANVGEWVEFETTLDFRHDLYALVSFDGGLYREESVNVNATAAGTMRHRLVRVYPDA